MVLEWNARLRLTAGRCRCKPNGTADIELSTKVCDTPGESLVALLFKVYQNFNLTCGASSYLILGSDND